MSIAFDWGDTAPDARPARTVHADHPRVQDILHALYATLPDPGQEPAEILRSLPEPIDPHADYPWIDTARVEELEAGEESTRARKSARFQRRYGFHWRLGPALENEITCEACGHRYCRPVGHYCRGFASVPAVPATADFDPDDYAPPPEPVP